MKVEHPSKVGPNVPYRISVTMPPAEARHVADELRDLLGTQAPEGDMSRVPERYSALVELLKELERA